jgi:hypothetical protein
MANECKDRLSAIRARLQAATQEPWACEPSTDGKEVYGLRIGAGAIGFDNICTADIDLISNAPDDLRWAVEEIDHLRRYIAMLGEHAYALEALKWALENPAPGRLERCQQTYEEARATMLATPNWRDGECQGGCRRYATHELVIERSETVTREPRCEKCGKQTVAAVRTATAAGWQPTVTLRLEPIAQQSDEAKGVRE